MQEAQSGQILPLSRYEACWFFEYADGRIKKGIFNYAGKGNDTAYAQPKNGLIRAGIIARCGNRKEYAVLNCDGQDYCNFEWVAGKSAMTGRGKLLGLTLVTRDQRATFIFDGSVEVKDRDPSEDVLLHYGKQY